MPVDVTRLLLAENEIREELLQAVVRDGDVQLSRGGRDLFPEEVVVELRITAAGVTARTADGRIVELASATAAKGASGDDAGGEDTKVARHIASYFAPGGD